jgi:hypothetical protein
MQAGIRLFSPFAAVDGPDDLISIDAPAASCIASGFAAAALRLAGSKRRGTS